MELGITSLLLRNFTFNELSLVTRNFKLEGILGVGGFGSGYKGRINESESSSVKTDVGLAVAMIILSTPGLQSFRK